MHEPRQPRKRNGELKGDTLYFGGRGKNGGGKYLRIYNKTLESKGVVDSVHWECECSKKKAQHAFFKLSQCAFASLLVGLIGGCIDFVERKDKNLGRATRFEWWQSIVDLLGRVVLRNAKI